MPAPPHVDTIVPRSQGGETVWVCERAAQLEDRLHALVAVEARYEPPGPGR
jgi:hypothetical protein